MGCEQTDVTPHILSRAGPVSGSALPLEPCIIHIFFSYYYYYYYYYYTETTLINLARDLPTDVVTSQW